MRFLLVISLASAAMAWTSTTGPRSFHKTQKPRPFSFFLQQAQPSEDASSKTTATTTTTSSSKQPKIGSVVTVKCRLVPEGDFVPEPLINGVVFRKNDDDGNEDDPSLSNFETLTFVLGRGNYLPGLHETILSMQKVGDCVKNISLDAGWGNVNPNLIATLSFADSGIDKSQLKNGVQLQLSNGMTATVTAVTEDDFTIDANPPMAGASYRADIELLNVEDGPEMTEYSSEPGISSSRYQVATFALGCFWGGELEFMRTPGVVGTDVGYTQGQQQNPTYQEVCSGRTGHTEAIAVVYNPDQVSYQRLVQLAMDRLGENRYLLNQVGNDKGTQYRHGVYYHTPQQKKVALEIVPSFGQDCVTECLPATKFWFAEEYHQQYLLKGGQSARKGEEAVIRCYG